MASLAELQDRFQRHIVHNDNGVTGDISGPDDAYRQVACASTTVPTGCD